MAYSYEEIRAVTLDILAGRERTYYSPTQYENLILGVAEVLERRKNVTVSSTDPNTRLAPADSDLFLEVFWDLFRQGIITLGLNNNNREFPWFKVTNTGRKIIENQSGYFFHDVQSYEKIILSNIPSIEAITLFYLKEAVQAFHAGCLLSSTVMLGVAAEHTFELLMETIEKKVEWNEAFSPALKETKILNRFNKFRSIMEKHLDKLPYGIKEDLDTNFAGIQALIRNFRNESGHPTGKFVNREQTFVLLQLFIPYCKKLYALMSFFNSD